jgi:hypothetical protein
MHRISMDRLIRGWGLALLLAATALHAGCSGGASGLTTGTLPADAPAGAITNEHPMARPISTAWISARAKRCGFYFDPAKLRNAYLAYETQHGAAPDQLGKIQSTYDSTFNTISARIGADAGYCSDHKTADIKGDLQKLLAGDFTPNLPKPKPDNSCGFFGCASSSSSNQPFDTKDFWKKQDDNKVR